MTDAPRLIGRKEAAAYCGITPTCFSMWVAQGKMPPAIPGTRKWDRKAIDAKLDEISGLAADRKEDEFDRWERLNGKGGPGLSDWRKRRDARKRSIS